MGLPDTRISGLPWAATTSRLSDKQVAVYAVDYPATCDFMKAVDGAADARARVGATAASCPSTEIFLGDYSQGAAVIDLITGPEDGAFGLAPSALAVTMSTHTVSTSNPACQIRLLNSIGERLPA